jgi:hypothetical protein
MPFCRAPGPPQAPPQGPPGEDRALRQAYLDLQHLHKLKLFLESEVAAPEADADEHSVRTLQLDLKNLLALEARLTAETAQLAARKKDEGEHSLAYRLFMSKFQYGP